MSKLDKIIILFNLLHHRRVVSMNTITELCGITERTAYRYIGTLSRANVPIYYDRDAGGYRLSSEDKIGMGSLSIGETCLILVALDNLADRLNDAYGSDISNLIRKIIAEKEFPLDEFWGYYKQRISSPSQDKDPSSLLTSVLLQFAVLFKRRVHISLSKKESQNSVEILTNPKMHFKNDWEIVAPETAKKHSSGVPMNSIEKASIL